MEERAEHAGHRRHDRDRVGLEEDVDRARGRRDRVLQLRRDRQQLAADPEERRADRVDLALLRVVICEIDRDACDRVDRQRHPEGGDQPVAQVAVRGRHGHRHRPDLAQGARYHAGSR